MTFYKFRIFISLAVLAFFSSILVLFHTSPLNIGAYIFSIVFTAILVIGINLLFKELHKSKTSNTALLKILDTIDADIYLVDIKSYRILYMNKQMINSFGGDFTGRICYEAFRNKDEACPHCIIKNKEDTAVWEGYNSVAEKWYLNHDRIIPWIDGRIVKLQVALDITRRKSAEEKHREIENRFTAFMEHLPASVFIDDASGKAVYFNKYHNNIFGSSQMVGKHLKDLLPPEMAGRLLKENKQVLKGMKIEKQEIMKDVQGKDIHFRTIKFLINGKGEQSLIGGIGMDITDLANTQNQLQTALEEKELMYREAHHRIKNNLSLIISLINLQKCHQSDKVYINFLNDLQNRIQSIAGVHEVLLAGEDRKSINLPSYIQRLAEQITNSVKNSNYTNYIDLSLENSTIDEKRIIPLGLVINELVTNALKYGNPVEEKPFIYISLYWKDNSICFSIENEGPGIPEKINIEEPETFGFQLIHTLMLQLEGSFTIEDRKRAKMNICFPGNIRTKK